MGRADDYLEPAGPLAYSHFPRREKGFFVASPGGGDLLRLGSSCCLPHAERALRPRVVDQRHPQSAGPGIASAAQLRLRWTNKHVSSRLPSTPSRPETQRRGLSERKPPRRLRKNSIGSGATARGSTARKRPLTRLGRTRARSRRHAKRSLTWKATAPSLDQAVPMTPVVLPRPRKDPVAVHIPRHDCHSFFHSSRAVRDRG